MLSSSWYPGILFKVVTFKISIAPDIVTENTLMIASEIAACLNKLTAQVYAMVVMAMIPMELVAQ
jgi:hypothetical protein